MDTETKIDVFGVLAVLLFGSVLGGAATYQHMDSRIDTLETQVENKESRETTLYVNQSSRASLTDIFQKVDQSVVSVRAIGTEDSQGSGFIYSKNGHIVTNQHVVENADRVQVSFSDGETVNARVIGTDLYTDLAVIKVNRNGLEPLDLGNSSEVQVGQRAIAVGNPFGLRSSMTAGIISQKGRLLPVEGGFSIPNVLQTDAAINPGNSGGPLLNSRGEVVGVNTAIETRTGTFSGIGFAIPVNTVKQVVPSLVRNGDYDHPWIGVSGRTVGPGIAEAMDLEEAKGFMIVDVVDGSPADRAGLKAGNRTVEISGREIDVGGDVIVAIDGNEMRDITDILVHLDQHTEVGETVNMTVIRDGERVTVPLTLDSRPQD